MTTSGLTLGEARRMALGLPEVSEQDHHGISSFRVRGKIFATVPDSRHLRIMVDEFQIRAAVAEHPDTCQEFYWGKRLACVVVDLAGTTRQLINELLVEAWARKAPSRLVQTLDRFPDTGSSPDERSDTRLLDQAER